MPLQVDRPADLAAFVGTELQSEAFALTQSDIDRFVALSGDRRWIHSGSRFGRGVVTH
jgi:acyl dehydratase